MKNMIFLLGMLALNFDNASSLSTGIEIKKPIMFPAHQTLDNLYKAFMPTGEYDGEPQILLCIAIAMGDIDKAREAVVKFGADPNEPLTISTMSVLRQMNMMPDDIETVIDTDLFPMSTNWVSSHEELMDFAEASEGVSISQYIVEKFGVKDRLDTWMIVLIIAMYVMFIVACVFCVAYCVIPTIRSRM